MLQPQLVHQPHWAPGLVPPSGLRASARATCKILRCQGMYLGHWEYGTLLERI